MNENSLNAIGADGSVKNPDSSDVFRSVFGQQATAPANPSVLKTEILRSGLFQYESLIIAFVSAIHGGDENKVLEALARIRIEIEGEDISRIARFCIRKAIERNRSLYTRHVAQFFEFGTSVEIPIRVTFRRQVVEEATYQGSASVQIEDIEIDKDGDYIVRSNAKYNYDKDEITRKKQVFKGDVEAKFDPDASWLIEWNKKDIRIERDE